MSAQNARVRRRFPRFAIEGLLPRKAKSIMSLQEVSCRLPEGKSGWPLLVPRLLHLPLLLPSAQSKTLDRLSGERHILR